MNRWMWAFFPAAALMAGATCGWYVRAADRLLILDVGQGDCAAFQTEGVTILIDDGPAGRNSNPGAVALRQALRRNGISSVDLVLLSHPDADHVGGTPELLREFPHARLAISRFFASRAKMLKELESWRVDPAAVVWMSAKSQINCGASTLDVVCPPVTDREDDNRGSMFVRIQDHGATADFSGDAPMQVESAVGKSGDWRADILHVGHHGSRTATGEDWLAVVLPRIAVISCGKDNIYGHPHQIVLDRLQNHRITVLRTDLMGDVSFVPVSGHFERSD